MIHIEINDTELQRGLKALRDKVGDMRPVLQVIGEDIMERAKLRFETSTGPDGQRWQPNAASTVLQAIARMGSKARLKNGNLNSRAQKTLAGKKVLVDTGALARQFHVSADANSVTIGNSMIYAAIHQFGGQAGRGRNVDIPARPFLPVTKAGELTPDDRQQVLDTLQRFLSDAIGQ